MIAGPRPRTRRLALVAIVLANVFGGVSYPLQKAALEGLPAGTVTWLRNALAVVALFVFLRWRGRPAGVWPHADRRRAWVLGTLAFALPMWLGIVGVQRSSAANGSILILLEPVTIVALAWLVYREAIGPLKLASLVLGLLGALVIVFGEGASLSALLDGRQAFGNALLALHGVLWGCYTPLAKPLTERHDPLELALRAAAIGTLALTPVALLEFAQWHAGPELAQALGYTAVLGLFVSFGSTAMWLWALRHLPSTSVAGFVFLQPLAGVLVGTLFLGETLERAVWLGGALIAVGVGLDVVLTVRAGRAEGQRGAT